MSIKLERIVSTRVERCLWEFCRNCRAQGFVKNFIVAQLALIFFDVELGLTLSLEARVGMHGGA